MALKRKFFLSNTQVNPPRNAPEMSIKMNFEKDALDSNGNRKLSLSITDLEWNRNEADKINAYFNSGNVFQGMPMRYELERGGVNQKIFDGYNDLSDPNSIFSALSCVVPAKEKQSIDWLNDTADSVSFEYLFSIGVITNDDFKFQPYILNSIPDYMQAGISILSVFFMEQQIQKLIVELAGMIGDLANPITAINTTIKAVLYLVYIIGLIVALIVLVKQMIKYIIQPVKYHACMNVNSILTKLSSYWGFTFNSDIFSKAPFDKLMFMPEKYYNALDVSKGIFGFTKPQKILQRGYPSGTPGDFLRAIKIAFKCKIVIKGTTLSLVPEYVNTGGSQYRLPPLEKYASPSFKTNASELKSNYLLQFQTDISDKNTIQQYLGTSYQVITTPVTVIDPALNVLKGLEEVNIPFALAKRKTELTIPEEIFKAFEVVFDKITNVLIDISNGVISAYNAIAKTLNKVLKALKVIGININWQAKSLPKIEKVVPGAFFENRIGMMMLETDLFTVPKLFLMDEGSEDKYNKISTDNSTILSAKYLWENFHAPVVSFLPSSLRPNGNQYIIRQFEKVPFNYDDFTKVIKNNNIFTNDNKLGIIDSGEWNDWHEYASLKVRINQMFTVDSNGNQTIKETYLEPDGR